MNFDCFFHFAEKKKKIRKWVKLSNGKIEFLILKPLSNFGMKSSLETFLDLNNRGREFDVNK